VQEQGPLRRQAGRYRLVAQVADVGRERRMNPAPPSEAGEQFVGRVDLQIVVRPIALVGAHHRRERGHFAPTHDELGRAHLAAQRRVAAAIGVAVGIADQPGRQRRRDHRVDAVVA